MSIMDLSDALWTEKIMPQFKRSVLNYIFSVLETYALLMLQKPLGTGELIIILLGAGLSPQ